MPTCNSFRKKTTYLIFDPKKATLVYGLYHSMPKPPRRW